MHATFIIELQPPDAVLRIAGELDIADENRLRNHLADLLDCASGRVVLDLSALTFVDCSCMAVIDRLRTELLAEGRALVIEDASLTFRLVATLAEYDALVATVADQRVAPLRRRARGRRSPAATAPAS